MLNIAVAACKFSFYIHLWIGFTICFFCYSCDSMTFYNGDSSASPFLAHYCGISLPSNFISPSNRIFIHFKTDESTKETGFELEYKAISSKLVELHAGFCLCWKIMEYLPNNLKSKNDFAKKEKKSNLHLYLRLGLFETKCLHS